MLSSPKQTPRTTSLSFGFVASTITLTKYNSFFRYCQRKFGKNKQLQRPEDSMLIAPRQQQIRSAAFPPDAKGDEEIELITDFSWRNFFSNINFVRIIQKLSKHRSHRIWMLVQYKSAVSHVVKVNAISAAH